MESGLPVPSTKMFPPHPGLLLLLPLCTPCPCLSGDKFASAQAPILVVSIQPLKPQSQWPPFRSLPCCSLHP